MLEYISLVTDYRMKNIHIFCINLKKRPERWNEFSTVMTNNGFNDIERIDGVNGETIDKNDAKHLLSVRGYKNLGNHKTDHFGIFTNGTLGCYLSHMNTWRLIVERNLEGAVIFEDDTTPTNRNAKEDMFWLINQSRQIPSLSGIFFDYNSADDIHFDESFVKLNDFYLANAYYLTNLGAKQLLNRAIPIELQVDRYISFLTQQDPSIIFLGSKNKLFKQTKHHKSDIQTFCPRCSIDIFRYYNYNSIRLIFMISIIIILFVICYRILKK